MSTPVGGRKFHAHVINPGDTVRWSPPRGRKYREGVVTWIANGMARIEHTAARNDGGTRTSRYTVPLSELTRVAKP